MQAKSPLRTRQSVVGKATGALAAEALTRRFVVLESLLSEEQRALRDEVGAFVKSVPRELLPNVELDAPDAQHREEKGYG
jgi:hypothetical protein